MPRWRSGGEGKASANWSGQFKATELPSGAAQQLGSEHKIAGLNARPSGALLRYAAIL